MLNKIDHSFTIKDLEQLSGVKAHTIRIWESRYQVLKPERTGYNFRQYSTKDLKHLLNVVQLYTNGFKISKIAQLSPEELRYHVRQLTDTKIDSVYINALKAIVLDFDEQAFTDFFETLAEQFDDDYLFEHILFPFLIETGTLWQTSELKPINEHFISNLVKQKLFALIDQLPLPSAETTEREFVLFLPPNELHELSLLYLHYTLRKNGEKSIYLGQSVPIANLKRFISSTKKRVFVASSVLQVDQKTSEIIVSQCAKLLSNTTEFLLHLEQTEEALNLEKHKGLECFDSKMDLLKAINKRLNN
ncbi:MAG: MerR family transcriptional regulator [Flavobacteriales bacterium]